VPVTEVRRTLTSLGFTVGEPSEAWAVDVPSWRGDVTREVDLVEEVARHHGLDTIPSTIPPASRVEGLRPEQRRDRRLRDTLVGAGLTEVITYSFVPVTSGPGCGPAPIALANPLSQDQGVMRTSIVFPGLLQALRTNLRQGRHDVGLFELGRVFGIGSVDARSGAGPEEPRLGIVLAGATLRHWSGAPRSVDFFDLKGLLELLAARFGVRTPALRPSTGAAVEPVLHPGQSAVLEPLAPGRPLEFLGALHPDLVARWELKEAPLVAELDPARFEAGAPVRVQALARFPSVERDLSVVVPAPIEAAAVAEAIRSAAGGLLRDVRVTARYDRPPVPAGRVSLTLTLGYQDPARTLTGEEVKGSIDRVVADLRSRGWEIRE
jgi:phenylalanyl-tRNA synthetase beta chain